jgi:toxin CcdB
MAQFVAYKNRNPLSRKIYPYLLDVQSDFLSELSTTIVVPLTPVSKASDIAISKLNPEVDIKRDKFIVMTQDIAGINRNELRDKICDLSHYRSEIIAAIDFVISGI